MTQVNEQPVLVKVNAARFGATLVEGMEAVCERNRGESQLALEMDTREGRRRLCFGDEYRVRPSAAFYTELLALLARRGAAFSE